jgi:uncharacterized protein (TIGR03437 family)
MRQSLSFLTASLFAIASAFSQSYPAPAPVFSKLFGGVSGADTATGLAVDANGNVAVLGTTNSPDFPVTNVSQPRVTQPPLVAVSASGVTYPAIAAVDVTALAASADGSVIYAASDSGIYRSADGGATWTQQKPGIAGANSIAVDGGSVNTLYANVAPNLPEPGGLYKSTDGGSTWNAITSLFFMRYGFSGTLRTPSRISGTIYATANGFYRSRDSGVTWVGIGPHNYNVFSFALAPSDPSVVYTVASDGILYRSSDGGDTWTAPGGSFTAYPNANALLYTYALAVDAKNENTVWAVTATGNLSKSTDGGATFATVLQAPSNQPVLYLSISASDSIMIVSGRGGGMASFDGGASWHIVFSGIYLYAVLATPQAILGGTFVGQQGFLTKWSTDGSKMLFSTFLDPTGGNGSGVIASDSAGNTWVLSTTLTKFDSSGNQVFSPSLAPFGASAIVVDSSGNVYLAGADSNSPCAGSPDALTPAIMKLDPQGNLVSSTRVPQLCTVNVRGLAVDASGAIYLVGNTMSTSLPTTPTAIQPTAPAAPPSSSPAPLPNAGYGVLAILSPQGQITYLSYIGGGQSATYGVTVDAGSNVYVTGISLDFSVPLAPTSNLRAVPSCSDGVNTSFAFVVKLMPSSRTPSWFTEIGGGCGSQSQGSQVAIDTAGNVWVGGLTNAGLFPTVAPVEVQGYHTNFVSELTPDGRTLLFSSYAPGYFALGPGQTLYLAGPADPNPPKLGFGSPRGAVAADALIEKFDTSATQPAVIDDISPIGPPVDSTQYLTIAPGEIIQIKGRNLGPPAAIGAQLDTRGRVATALGGTRILFDGIPAPLISVKDSSVVCMTPFEVSGENTSSVQIERNGIGMPGVIVGVTAVALLPGVLSIANEDGTLNSQSNPARSGQPVILYVTGFGDTLPSLPDGSVYQSPLPVALYPINSYGAEMAYAGPAPGTVAGIWQINLIMPTPIYNPSSSLNNSGRLLNIQLVSSYLIDALNPSVTAPVWFAP